LNHYQPSAHTRGLFYLEKPLPKSQKPRKKGQRASAQWGLEDDAFLGELQATGKFKEQPEEAK
jgi:hypothetical protein